MCGIECTPLSKRVRKIQKIGYMTNKVILVKSLYIESDSLGFVFCFKFLFNSEVFCKYKCLSVFPSIYLKLLAVNSI